MREDIRKLMKAGRTCVLATVSGKEPHCSLMSYATDDDCCEIYMATRKDTKKYRNLVANPSVSLLIDSRETGGKNRKSLTRALTVTGTIQGGVDEQKRKAVRERLFKRHPDLIEFFDDSSAEIIVVQIKALQLLDGITDAYFEAIL
jgi:nitroimidazol reductase NimA-like FMN-containing flavoprotein (pyridoxamine 5'-phosphate oxidase superfamily)